MFNKFTRLYKISKTLRFELKPVGKTLENMEKSGILDRDLARSKEYQTVKDLLDLEHKALIERVTSRFDEIVETNSNGRQSVDWQKLAMAYETYRKSGKEKSDREQLENATAAYRKLFAEALSSDEHYDELTETTPSKFIKTLLKVAENDGKTPNPALEMFSKFACYFKGFQENRRNIYSSEAQVTSAANRAINENFPKFLDCCSIFRHLELRYPSIIADAERELSPILNGRRIADVFSVANYSKVLSQAAIDDFNSIVGGYVPKSGKKLRGINEFINPYRQQHEEAKIDRRLAKMPQLFKQILSDRETISFVSEAFTEDAQVLRVIGDFGEKLSTSGVLADMWELLKQLEARENIFIDSELLPSVSKNLCGDWAALGRAMETIVESREKSRAGREKLLKRAEYPMSEFVGMKLPDESSEGEWRNFDITDAWKNDAAKAKFDAVEKCFAEAQKALGNTAKSGLRERVEDVALIKKYLDSVLDVLHLVKPLHVSADLERDMEFYGEFDELYNRIDEVVPLYNRVRNYVTKKNCESEKMKLMFDCATIGEGWEINKEMDRRSTILEKDGQYFLAIIPSTEKSADILCEFRCHTEGLCYRKMVYKQIPNAGNYFSVKQFRPQDPPQYVLDYFEPGKDKKTAGKAALSQAVKYVIDEFIPNYKPLQTADGSPFFNFKFKDPSQYESWKEFCDDVVNQAYLIRFENVSAFFVDELVESGKLYLFRLHCKDFSAGATGRENLHTTYWRKLFESQNLDDLSIKLCGGAEFFYRRATVTRPYKHKVGEKMINRRDRNGNSIDGAVTKELFDFANGRTPESGLSDAARALLRDGMVTIKDVKHEIVKDARYTKDKFFFHVPIMINPRKDDKLGKSQSAFNRIVNLALRDIPEDVNVIGIDRGERHLLYVAVVNRNGEILEQRSFNTLGHEAYDGKVLKFDYHKKLDQVEKARDAARKSWTTIGKIKDLKAGYLSVVVHEIAQMMMKYNAVIALEDLNFGFKRGRFAIEKQVYQKFEKALIDKFNYLVFKDRKADAPGGSLRGYQLTAKFESFQKMGKQTGFIYYVPAAYTSKIDPTTGFTNLFDTKRCTNTEGIKEFFLAFNSIRFCKADNAFAFAFDYKNFKTRLKGHRTAWTVYSSDRRLVFDKAANAEKEIFPTRIILDALENAGEKVDDGYDLLAYLGGLEASRENARLFKDVFYAFERTLQMRNSRAKTGDDYIQSPVKNGNGEFYDSRKCGVDLPQNADANGAYHIALKGLWIVNEALKREWKNDVPDLKLDNEEWFRFAQTRNQ